MFKLCGIISVSGRFITKTADKFLRPVEMSLYEQLCLVLSNLQGDGNRNFSMWLDFFFFK